MELFDTQLLELSQPNQLELHTFNQKVLSQEDVVCPPSKPQSRLCINGNCIDTFDAELDFGGFPSENAKKTKSNDIKEVKMSYKIGEHDYDVRKRSALKFLEGGHRVKCVVQFRGREQQHMDLGGELLQKLAGDCEEVGKAGGRPKREGNRLTLFLKPKSEK